MLHAKPGSFVLPLLLKNAVEMEPHVLKVARVSYFAQRVIIARHRLQSQLFAKRMATKQYTVHLEVLRSSSVKEGARVILHLHKSDVKKDLCAHLDPSSLSFVQLDLSVSRVLQLHSSVI